MTVTARDGDGAAVAIIGMSCLFPGAPDIDAYWNNIVNKVDSVTDAPPESWDGETYFDADFEDTDKVYCRRGGYLGSLLTFDPLPHGIPPVSVGGEPDQWVALQLARDALADAGWSELPVETRHRTAVVLGKGTYLNGGNAKVIQRSLVVGQTLDVIKQLHPEFGDAEIDRLRQEMKRVLPGIGPETVPGLIPNIVVGRIANRLDLMGPTYTIDAACASSLVAMQLAMRDLVNGECDLALAGGSQVWMPVPTLNVFCHLNALSRNQEIRPFDKDADGTLLGEGIGMVVLKRLADAEADGDRIYAVLRGVGVASDGRGTSVMAPRVDGEELALRRAYEVAGVAPESIGLIEAHGTATPIGDAVEIEALSRVFGSSQGELPSCAIGTVKSMISHTIPASGVAGVIKCALALYHKVLPPTLHCDQPNPELDRTTFYVNTETRPWVHGGDQPRRAGVNAFGFGGINAHAVLEEHAATGGRELPGHQARWGSEICVLEAETADGLRQEALRLATLLPAGEAEASFTLADLASTLAGQIGPSAGTTRLAIVAASLADLGRKLERAAGKLADPNCRRIKDVSGIYYTAQPVGAGAKVAFLFPGEGAQYPGMLSDLCLNFPEARQIFDRADRIGRDEGRPRLPSDDIFPRPGFSDDERRQAEERLMRMDTAIESVFTANQAMHAVLGRLGLHADACVGHSSGEYAAALASGVVDLDTTDGIRGIGGALRRAYAEAASGDGVPKAALLALAADRQRAEEIAAEAGGEIHLAMDNCPHQAVLVGEPDAVDRARKIADREGVIYEVLPYDRAVHTPLFAPYAEGLRQVFARPEVRDGHTVLYSCTTGRPYPAAPDEVRNLFVEQWFRPVEFRRTIESLYDDGARVFVEVGPRGNLAAFAEDTLRGREALVVPADVRHRPSTTQLNHLVGQLVAHGVDLDLGQLFAYRSVRRVERPELESARAPAANPTMSLAQRWPMLRLSPDVVDEVMPRSEPSGGSENHRAAPTPPPVVTSPAEPAPDWAAVAPSTPAPDWAAVAPPTPAAEWTTPSPLPVGLDAMAAVIAGHLSTMDRFLAVNQEIMQSYLRAAGTGEAPPPAAVVRPVAPAVAPLPVSEPVFVPPVAPTNGHTNGSVAAPAPFPTPEIEAPPAPAVADLRAEVTGQLLALISERTGYPEAMLDHNLDLEADLGIDSIKRVEILGNYRQQSGRVDEIDLELLAAQRTIAQIIDVLAPAAGEVPRPAVVATNGHVDLRAEVTGQLLALISERTGYPEAMLDHNLDLEADLGIDSIKRVEILGNYRQQSGRVDEIDLELLAAQRTIAQIIDVLAEPAGSPPAAAPPPAAAAPDHGEVVVRRTFDLAEDLYLGDHVLGRDPSAPASGLPVMPLTMSLEILAEAAAGLVPDHAVIGLRDVTALRWLALEKGAVSVEISVRLQPGTGPEKRVAVELRNLSEPDPTPVITAAVLLAPDYPEAPAPLGAGVAEGRPSGLAPDRLYAGGMFHGPMWQGVTAMVDSAPGGATATLRVLPFTGFSRRPAEPPFLLDPIVLDAAGQVIGFWAAEQLASANVVFPFRLAALDVFGPLRPTGEDIACRARIALDGAQLVRSDIDMVGADGRLWMRMTGWEDKRFEVSPFLRPLVTAGGPADLSSPWLFGSRRVDVDVPGDRKFWKQVWAGRILGPNERAAFAALRVPEARQLEWLGGRTAAKEALRALLAAGPGIEATLADIEIQPDAAGRPVVSGPWRDRVPGPLGLSIAHSDGVAVAVVGASDYLGIDVERVRTPGRGFGEVAFDDEERQRLSGLPEEWALRCWCAKEAVAKATGSGLSDGPRSVVITAVDPLEERLTARLAGRLAEAHPDLAGVDLVVQTRQVDDVVVAVAQDQRPPDEHAAATRPEWSTQR